MPLLTQKSKVALAFLYASVPCVVQDPVKPDEMSVSDVPALSLQRLLLKNNTVNIATKIIKKPPRPPMLHNTSNLL